MCTVAIVHLGDGGYRLGHNRDERRTRARGTAPVCERAEGVRYLAPGDPEGGGTWIAVNEAGVSACLLNAADVPGRAPVEDPRSRGLLVREAMSCRTIEQAVARFSGQDREWGRRRAFHLVIATPGDTRCPPHLARLTWDGAYLRWDRPGVPALFTSSTWQGGGVDAPRRELWNRWLAASRDPAAEVGAWLAGHDPVRGPLSVCMHRDEAHTVSRTLVSVSPRGIVLDYLDGSPCARNGPYTVVSF